MKLVSTAAAVLLLVLAASVPAHAQLTGSLNSLHDITVTNLKATADKVPADLYDFRPTDEVRTHDGTGSGMSGRQLHPAILGDSRHSMPDSPLSWLGETRSPPTAGNADRAVLIELRRSLAVICAARAPLTQCVTFGLARGGSAPFDPPDARAPAEFAGGGLPPVPLAGAS